MTSAAKALPAVLERIDADLDRSLERLFELVRIPSISTDSAYKDFCRAAADFVAKDLDEPWFRGRGPTDRRPSDRGRQEQRRDRTECGPRVLFYGHYDVQPVDPLTLWSTPPFEPKIDSLPDGRKIIRGRGACDDKGQLMTFVEACRAFKAVTGKLPLDITMMIEGEEECGSKSLFDFVRSNAAEFKRDLALVCDTGMWDPKTPVVTTSLRGLLYEEVVITCADRDLHSGVFGGGAANPIRILSRIIAGLHDESGRVTLPGFYDGVKDLPDRHQGRAEGAEPDAGAVSRPGRPEGPGRREGPHADRAGLDASDLRRERHRRRLYGRGRQDRDRRPGVGEDLVPAGRHAGPGEDPRRRSAPSCASRLPADCDRDLHRSRRQSGAAVAYDNPALGKARAALTEEWGTKAVAVGSGGSIPIVGDFKNVLGMDTLLVGFGLDDDRVHSPNEKYDLTSFHKGTRSWARILAALAG